MRIEQLCTEDNENNLNYTYKIVRLTTSKALNYNFYSYPLITYMCTYT